MRGWTGWTLSMALALASGTAHADDVLRIVEVRLDRPTLHVLGVQVTISDDDDHDAEIRVRVREVGGTYRDATPLIRVRPDHVADTVSIPEQFAGSVFDLAPDTEYELELHAIDPDGVDETRTITGRTRPVPREEPESPRVVSVASATELRAALSAATAGDVITLAAGTYDGAFSIDASGTPTQPIVIRGAGPTTILDGGGCTDCNVLEVYGSYVHVERLAMRHAIRALRFQGTGATGAGVTGNVARRLRIDDVVHGIGSRPGQRDFYVCDNELDGRLTWPWTFATDATSHWDDRGVDLNGDGHVVCHNRIRGFGDPIVNKTRLSRAWDVYGNDIADAYDGTELDEAAGNVRLFGNRFTNVMVPISIQPIFGGPAYVIRNVVFNAPEEQIKLKSLGGTEEPSGALIWHNTFVSPNRALNLQAPITQYDFRIENNLFIGPAAPSGRAVDWTANLVEGVFDYDGYWPDEGYWLGRVAGANRVYATLAEAQAAGVETNGVVLGLPIFEAMFVGPDDDGMTHREPPSFALAESSNAIDRGRVIAGINASAPGAGPDLGAWERGCPEPRYGPRPEGEESTLFAVIDCRMRSGPIDIDAGLDRDGGSSSTDGGPTTPRIDGGVTAPDPGGCGCAIAKRSDPAPWLALIVLIGTRPRARRRAMARSPRERT